MVERVPSDCRVADLDGDRLELEDLASDVAGALQRSEQRAYRYTRIVDLSQILASGPVVPRGTRAVRFGTSAVETSLERVQIASLTTSESIPGYDVTVATGPGQVVLRRRSLSEFASAGQLTMRRGSRIDLATAVAGGTVRVLSADGSTDGIQLDPFDAARIYPRATRTEPGDVVFLEHPGRPPWWIVTEGRWSPPEPDPPTPGWRTNRPARARGLNQRGRPR